MKKNKVIVSLASVLFIIFGQTNVFAASASKDDGTYSYYQETTIVPNKSQPVVESQAEHITGYTTQISLTTTISKSETASASLTVGGSVFGAELSTKLEVSQQVGCSVAAGVSYTIPATQPHGWYRIDVVFPNYKVDQYKWRDSDGRQIFSQTIEYAPKTNAAYKTLNNYQS